MFGGLLHFGLGLVYGGYGALPSLAGVWVPRRTYDLWSVGLPASRIYEFS